jgi:hypothetical protein
MAVAHDLTNTFKTAMQYRLLLQTLEYKTDSKEKTAMEIISSLDMDQLFAPSQIPEHEREKILMVSADAEIHKAQVNRIKELVRLSLSNLDEQTLSSYRHKRIKVTAHAQQAIYPLWRDKVTGRGYYSKGHPRVIKGSISELSLDENFFILKPTVARKLINKTIVSYKVFVIDPNTLEPLISISS